MTFTWFSMSKADGGWASQRVQQKPLFSPSVALDLDITRYEWKEHIEGFENTLDLSGGLNMYTRKHLILMSSRSWAILHRPKMWDRCVDTCRGPGMLKVWRDAYWGEWGFEGLWACVPSIGKVLVLVGCCWKASRSYPSLIILVMDRFTPSISTISFVLGVRFWYLEFLQLMTINFQPHLWRIIEVFRLLIQQ